MVYPSFSRPLGCNFTIFFVTFPHKSVEHVHTTLFRFYVSRNKYFRRRWEDNIRMDLEKIGINAGNWVDSAQDRNYRRALVNAALNLRVP